MIINSSQRLQEQFNSAYQAGAEQFELHVTALMFIFTVRIIIKFPTVHRFLDSKTNLDLYNGINDGLDIVAFFVVVMMYWALQGNPIVK